MRRTTLIVVAVFVAALSATVNVLAGGPVPVPEIDGGSTMTGLAILTAGVLLLRSRQSE